MRKSFVNDDSTMPEQVVLTTQVDLPVTLPDHTQLPCEDGTFVQNFQEHPQSMLLGDAILPVLHKRYPDGRFAIGQDCGI
jgi:hypothetical protein